VTDRPKKYRLQKLRLDEISIVDAGACEEAVVTIYKRGPTPQPGPDVHLSNSEADRVMQELIASIRKARDLIGQLPDTTPPRQFRSVEDSIKKLAAAQASAAVTLRQFQARQNAEAAFKGTGLSSLADLRKAAAEAEDLPRRLQAHRDQADLDTLREAKATIDRPIHPVDRDRRRVNDALDEEVRARQAQTGEAYVEAMDRILADRKRNRGG
jgi:hypothetical protein